MLISGTLGSLEYFRCFLKEHVMINSLQFNAQWAGGSAIISPVNVYFQLNRSINTESNFFCEVQSMSDALQKEHWTKANYHCAAE